MEFIFLPIAAALAGAVNALAGGGSLISFPALIAAGYSTKAASVTNAVAIWPGYVGGVYGWRHELKLYRKRALSVLPISAAGGGVGSAILLLTPADAFEVAAPLLILFACALMAAQDRLALLVTKADTNRPGATMRVLLLPSVFVLSVYGGYFQAGLGILIVAVLGPLLPGGIREANALKSALAMVITGVSGIGFALFGPVQWVPALLMCVAAIIGGYCGAVVARRLNRRALRYATIVFGVSVAVILLVA